ncbi:hypothetical protein C8Q78DRAFT_996170 [Trametes maxima]|nr:hypothetical protein C8Q78DRAFT_996170 [Trametes maxima]
MPSYSPHFARVATQTHTAVWEKYDYRCPFCQSNYGQQRHNIYYIVPPTATGNSQLAWLRVANLPCEDTVDSLDNMIPLCATHAYEFVTGSLTLCPPLDDLRKILSKSPSSKAPENMDHSEDINEGLSGYLSVLWIPRHRGEKLDLASGGTTMSWTTELSPPHLLYRKYNSGGEPYLPIRVNTDGAGLEISALFNPPGTPHRINPYLTLVHTMELLISGYAPSEIFFYEELTKGHGRVVAMKNPIETYEELLLSIRDHYAQAVEH